MSELMVLTRDIISRDECRKYLLPWVDFIRIHIFVRHAAIVSSVLDHLHRQPALKKRRSSAAAEISG